MIDGRAGSLTAVEMSLDVGVASSSTSGIYQDLNEPSSLTNYEVFRVEAIIAAGGDCSFAQNEFLEVTNRGSWATGVSSCNRRRHRVYRPAKCFFCLQLPSQPKIECRNCWVRWERDVVRLKHQKLGAKLGSNVRC